MAHIDISEHDMNIRLGMIDSLLGMQRTLSVPLAHIVDVRARPPEADFDRSVVDRSTGGGTFLEGVRAVGEMELADGMSFLDVSDPRRTIALDLDETQKLEHVIVQIDDADPEAFCIYLRSILTKYREHGSWRDRGTPPIDRPLPDSRASR